MLSVFVLGGFAISLLCATGLGLVLTYPTLSED